MKIIIKLFLYSSIFLILFELGHITYSTYKGLAGEGYTMGITFDELPYFVLGLVFLLVYFILNAAYRKK